MRSRRPRRPTTRTPRRRRLPASHRASRRTRQTLPGRPPPPFPIGGWRHLAGSRAGDLRCAATKPVAAYARMFRRCGASPTRRAAGHPAPRGHRRGHPRPPGRDRRRRDRVAGRPRSCRRSASSSGARRPTAELIGHTQPRRIAARVGGRADRRGARHRARRPRRLPGAVHGPTSSGRRVKLMTDGILLAEIQRDRQLRSYDTIIIDEAHERSLNIDFLLGYLKRLLPRRPDLKLIITSRRSTPSGSPRTSTRTPPDHRGLRPHLSGRGPLPAADGALRGGRRGRGVVRDQTEAIVDAVKELSAEGPGDILVFLPGEREIRDAADALERPSVRPLESCRCTPGCRPPSSTVSSPPPSGAGSCSPPTSPRPR